MLVTMNPETPLLSLCIPTYNRAVLLTQALDAILTQIGPEEAQQIEVLILDNASPDGTPAVIEDAARRSPHVSLRRVRHANNIGPDANFLEAICLASGEFVYLISDDDVLLPGGVRKLLEMIQRYPDFDAFSLNCQGFQFSPEEPGVPYLVLSEDLATQDKDEVLQMAQTSIGFMSIMAFRKARIADRIAAGMYADKIGTHFLQSYVFLDVLLGGNGFAAAATPMIAQRAENSTAFNYFQVFITEIHALMTYAQRIGFSRSVVRKIEAKNLTQTRHFISRVMIYGREREMWSSRRDAISRLFGVYGWNPYIWLVLVPLMFFPRPLRPLVPLVRRLLGRPEAAAERAARGGWGPDATRP